MPLAVQVVSSLSVQVRTLILALALTVFHGGKFPKSRKTVRFETGVLEVRFPEALEGISSSDIIRCQESHGSQASLIRALGFFYVVYFLFILSVMQRLVVGACGAKGGPSSEVCYKRRTPLYNRRVKSRSRRSGFVLSGSGFLDSLNNDKPSGISDIKPLPKTLGPRKQTTKESLTIIFLFIYNSPFMVKVSTCRYTGSNPGGEKVIIAKKRNNTSYFLGRGIYNASEKIEKHVNQHFYNLYK